MSWLLVIYSLVLVGTRESRIDRVLQTACDQLMVLFVISHKLLDEHGVSTREQLVGNSQTSSFIS